MMFASYLRNGSLVTVDVQVSDRERRTLLYYITIVAGVVCKYERAPCRVLLSCLCMNGIHCTTNALAYDQVYSLQSSPNECRVFGGKKVDWLSDMLSLYYNILQCCCK